MELMIKSELVAFVNEYNRVCKRNFDYEVKDEYFVIITQGFITYAFMEMFMERFSDKGLSFVIVYTGERLEMLISQLS